MAQADGTILINTEIKKDGAIEDIGTLKQALKELTAAVKDMTTTLTNAFSGTSQANTVAKQFDDIGKSAKEAEADVKSLEEQMSKITVDRGEQSNNETDEEQRFSHERGEFQDYGDTVQEFVDKYVSGMGDAEQSTNEFKKEIESLSNQLKDMESQGLYFGDDEYDEIYLKLEKIKQALIDYKKELTNPTESPKLDDSTMEGQVDALKRKLRQLSDQGKTFGDDVYDSAYKALKKAESELNDYKKELINPASIPVTLDPSSFEYKKQQLKAQLDDMEKRGITLGDPDYDRTYAALQNVIQSEKDYKKALLGADDGQKKVKKSADKMNKSMDKTGKSAKSAGKGMSVLKMLGTSIMFSFVFQAINGITTSVREGMENLARYSNDTNKTLSLLMSSLTMLKNSFAVAFSPILTLVTPALNKLITKMAELNNWISQTMAALMGKDTYVKAVQVQEDYAASLKDSKKAAKDAAKEAKKATFAFDTLIQAQKPADEEYKGPTPDEMFKTEQVSEKTKDMVNGISGAMDSVKAKLLDVGKVVENGFLKGLGNFKPVLKGLSQDLQSIGTNLKDIFSDTDVLSAADRFALSFADMVGKIAGAYASIGLTIAANVVGGIESYLSKNTDRIKGWLIRMFDVGAEINRIYGDFFVAFADVFSVFSSQTAQDITGSVIQIFADVFGGVIELTARFTRDMLDMILTPFIQNKDKIKTAIMETLEPVKVIIEGIASTVRKFVDGAVKLYDEHLNPLFASIRNGLTQLVDAWLDAFNNYIAPVLDKLADKFKEVMEGPVGDAIDSAMNLIGKLIDVVRLLWEKVMLPFFMWIINTLYPILAPALEAIGKVFIGVFGGIAELVSAVFDILSGLIDFIVGAFTLDWARAWEGIKQIFSGVWKGIKAIVETIINAIVDLVIGLVNTVAQAVGKIIDYFDKGQSKANSSGFGGGGRAFSISSYSASPYAAYSNNIPQLATGTVVPPKAGNFLAMLGDNNKDYEVVSPLGTIKQAVLEAIGEAGGLGGGTVQADLILDGTKFGQLVYKYNNKENDRVGVRMVTNGG